MQNKEKQIFIVPSWKCNLNCTHCPVKNQPDNRNLDKFLDSLNNLQKKYVNANFILHGGEPTYNKLLLKELLSKDIITSICTNLIIQDQEIIDYINNANISISTSWNVNRFVNNLQLYSLWLNNISKLKQKPLILFTLDKDIINIPIKEFINYLLDIQNTNNVSEILFECLVDNSVSEDFQDKCDIWLCNLYDELHSKSSIITLKNLIEEQILNWNFNCNAITLLPSGDIRSGCIIGETCKQVLNKCLTCSLAKICRPCPLHTRCSFFPKFYKKVAEHEN